MVLLLETSIHAVTITRDIDGLKFRLSFLSPRAPYSSTDHVILNLKFSSSTQP